MNKLTAIKIKYSDGTYSDEIPVAALAENVEWDNSHSLVDILGEVAFDTKGTIQDQITQISNSKVDSTDLNNYVNSTMKTEVTNWLSSYISPATGTISYDASLSIEGAAADAKAAGDNLRELNYNVDGIIKNTVLYNAGEFLQFGLRNDRNGKGVSFTFNSDGSCTLTTETAATANVVYNYYYNLNEIPPYIIPGKAYNVQFSGINVSFRIYQYINGTAYTVFNSKSNGQFTISQEATGIQILLYVKKGESPNETVNPKIMLGISNETLNNRTTLQYLESGSNLNNIYLNGKYILTNPENYLNTPNELLYNNSFLYVNSLDSVNNIINQIIIDNTANSIFSRYYDNNNNMWTQWITLNNPKNIFQNLLILNSVEVLGYTDKNNTTNHGVNYEFNSDGTCTVVGTTTNQTSYYNYYSNIDALPEWIIPGHKYYLQYESEMVLFRIYFYKNNEVMQEMTISTRSNKEFVVPLETSGIILRLAVNANQTTNETVNPKIYSGLANSVIADRLEKLENATTSNLHICSFNIGLYNYGLNAAAHPRQYIDEKIKATKTFLINHDFDIIGCQENNRNVGSSENPIYIDDIFTSAYPYYYRGEFSLTIASKYPLVNCRTGYFLNSYNGDTRGWVMGELIIGGKKIAITNSHLAYQDNEEAANIRTLQKAELMNMVREYDYAILLGDWNSYDPEEYNDFVNAGFTLTNGGYLYFKNTQPTIDPLYPLDNIIIKGKTNVKSFGKVLEPVKIATPTTTEDERDLYVSDHLPLEGKVLII